MNPLMFKLREIESERKALATLKERFDDTISRWEGDLYDAALDVVNKHLGTKFRYIAGDGDLTHQKAVIAGKKYNFCGVQGRYESARNEYSLRIVFESKTEKHMLTVIIGGEDKWEDYIKEYCKEFKKLLKASKPNLDKVYG